MARGFQHTLLDMTGFRKDHLLMSSFDPRLAQYNDAQTPQFGARPADVLWLMERGVVLVGIGTVFGVVMSFAVERLMNAMIFDVRGVDVTAYLFVVPLLVLVTMLAAYLPARRASSIAPTQALRYE